MKPLEYKAWHHPTTSSTLCRMPHPNNKQNGQSSADRITTSLSLAHQRKKKQTSKKQTNKKLSTNLTLYKAYTNHWTNLRRTEIKRKKEFNLEAWGKETLNNEKAEKC